MFSNSNEEKSLITYFEETYVLGKIGKRTRGRSNNVPSKNPPLFSPDIWSVSNRVKLELPRTTNTAESWHRMLNRLTFPHPDKNHIKNVIKYHILQIYEIFYSGLHKFITILQQIQAETEIQIEC